METGVTEGENGTGKNHCEGKPGRREKKAQKAE